MRFTALDSWRGIAALLVASFHFEATTHFHDLAFYRHSFFWVDFFFVLSGFVIAHAYGGRVNSTSDFAAFAIRRFGRLWPLNAAVMAALVGVETLKLVLVKFFGMSSGALPFDPHGYTPLHTIPDHLFMTTALGLRDGLTWNGPDWSISAEYWTYILIGIIWLATTTRRTAAITVTGIAAAAALIVFSRNGMDATYDLGFVRCLYGFMVGQLVYVLRSERQGEPPPAAEALEVVALICAIVFVSLPEPGALSFAAPLVFGFVVYAFSFERGPISRALNARPMRTLGDWSYSIYMVHALVWAVFSMGVGVVLRHFGIDVWRVAHAEGGADPALAVGHRFALDLLFAAYIAGVLVLASLTKRFIEDPGRRYFGRIADAVAAPRSSPAPKGERA